MSDAPFDNYEVHGIQRVTLFGIEFFEQVPDDEADFWCLFGHIDGEGLTSIGDFPTREQADGIRKRIKGEETDVHNGG